LAHEMDGVDFANLWSVRASSRLPHDAHGAFGASANVACVEIFSRQ